MELNECFSRIWTAFDAGQIMAVCAWCGRVRVDEAWVAPPRAALAAIDERHAFSHSICERCADGVSHVVSRRPNHSNPSHSFGRRLQLAKGAGTDADEGVDMHTEVETHTETQSQQSTSATEPVEPRVARLRRHAHRGRLYVSAIALVALLVVLLALAVANTRQVKLSWVVGTSHANLVWIIMVVAVLGWLLGITTAVVFRHRTRRLH
jgi:uncharacterized integral membrane protein